MEKVKASFVAAGFGLPPGTTDMNMSKIFASKFPGQFGLAELRILGFCSPPHALKALGLEPSAALLMPCNVCVATAADGVVEVSAIEPYALLGLVGRKDDFRELVEQLRGMIKKGLEGVVAE